MFLVQDMLVNGIGHRIWFGHWNFDVLDHFDGVRLFDFNGIGFLHSVRNFTFSYFGNYFVNWNLNFLLHRHMDSVGFWDLQTYNIRHLVNTESTFNKNSNCHKELRLTHLYSHRMWYGQWHLFNDMDRYMLRGLRVRGGCMLVVIVSDTRATADTRTTSSTPALIVSLSRVRGVGKRHAAD